MTHADVCDDVHETAAGGSHVQRSTLFCANISKKDPGRARQKSLATAQTNFTKLGAQNKGDLCRNKVHKSDVPKNV